MGVFGSFQLREPHFFHSASIMAYHLLLRFLYHTNGKFEVINTFSSTHMVKSFDIITYTWGAKTKPYNCMIEGVTWDVKIGRQKLEDIKRLMIKNQIQYLWVDCVCLNQDDEREMAIEVLKMYEYYKRARKCYILMDMDEVWETRRTSSIV